MSIDSTEIFEMHLTEPQLKVTYTALRILRDDLGHDQADVRAIVQQVLDKLPDEHTMRATRLNPAAGSSVAGADHPEP